MTEAEATIHQFGEEDAVNVLPRRSAGAHKWGVGGLFVIAGSPGYAGAATLCAMAAGRAGAGIVNLAVHRSLIPSIAPLVPETSFTILPDGDLGGGGKRFMETISAIADKCSAYVIGPGLGDDDYARHVLAALLGFSESSRSMGLGFGGSRPNNTDAGHVPALWRHEGPILVDADGLNALAKIDDWWSRLPERRLILTPHVGEMARLMDMSSGDVQADPDGVVISAATRFRQVVLLKSSPAIVTDGRVLYHANDSPVSLATAGSGDILAGTIGALLAQGLSLMDAANLGLYVGAKAARQVEQELGVLGVVASDLPRAIAVEMAALARI